MFNLVKGNIFYADSCISNRWRKIPDISITCSDTKRGFIIADSGDISSTISDERSGGQS